MATFPTKKTPPPPPFLILFLFLTTTTPTTNALRTGALDTVLTLLRTNSHALFANAIATSDLLFDLLSLPSVTLLCPPDPQLFALDMASLSPISYTSSLRAHVIPNSSLIISPPPANNNNIIKGNNTRVLHTLLPSRDLQVTRDSSSGVVTVDGVEVVLPGLYHSREVSVFRLRGILPPGYFPTEVSTAAPPPSLVVQNLNPKVSSPAVSSPTPMSFSTPPPVDRKMIVDSIVGAPKGVTAPTSSFAAGPVPESGWISGRYGEDRTVEECGPLDGERRMQCAVRDGDSDYAIST